MKSSMCLSVNESKPVKSKNLPTDTLNPLTVSLARSSIFSINLNQFLNCFNCFSQREVVRQVRNRQTRELRCRSCIKGFTANPNRNTVINRILNSIEGHMVWQLPQNIHFSLITSTLFNLGLGRIAPVGQEAVNEGISQPSIHLHG